MKTITLEYIYDPLCGWCYAAAPLIEIAAAHPNLSLSLNGGGMMAGANAKPVTPELRAFVQSQDKHIAEVSGQLFGHDYNDGLLKDETTVLDSAPPIAAVMVAEQWSKAPAMLHAIQQAHFVKGLKVADAAVLKELANAIAIPVDEFESRYQEAINNQLDEHIQWSRQILREVGANGFPTLVEQCQSQNIQSQTTQSQTIIHPISNYYGKPEAWQAYLDSQFVDQSIQAI